MRTLLVGYDLRKPGQAYEELFTALKAYGTYWHHLDSTWVIRTDESPVEVRDQLMRLLDINDKLLVIDITGRTAAWTGFAERGSTWLRQNL